MSDHIAAVRAQAKKVAEQHYPVYSQSGIDSALRASDIGCFIEGAEWVASRLTREKIAEELSKHHFVHGIGRSNSCHCGARVGEFAEYRNHEADAIMALLVADTQR
jgi:hypothetical protein